MIYHLIFFFLVFVFIVVLVYYIIKEKKLMQDVASFEDVFTSSSSSYRTEAANQQLDKVVDLSSQTARGIRDIRSRLEENDRNNS